MIDVMKYVFFARRFFSYVFFSWLAGCARSHAALPLEQNAPSPQEVANALRGNPETVTSLNDVITCDLAAFSYASRTLLLKGLLGNEEQEALGLLREDKTYRQYCENRDAAYEKLFALLQGLKAEEDLGAPLGKLLRLSRIQYALMQAVDDHGNDDLIQELTSERATLVPEEEDVLTYLRRIIVLAQTDTTSSQAEPIGQEPAPPEGGEVGGAA